MREVLAMDLGGTKLLLGRVNEKGQILEKKKISVNLSKGPDGLLKQIAEAANGMKTDKTYAAALSSAGPLDPIRGQWLNPTNLKTEGQSWGEVEVVSVLKEALGLPCFLENDAACAAMAESWLGQAKACENFISITLGTGLGVGVWANGQLVRSGRYLHTELGHLIIESGVGAALCGCGNRGCAEAYLSGTNFAKLVSQKMNQTLSGEDLLKLAYDNNNVVIRSFEDYSYRLALFIRNLIVGFYPEKIILSGGFAVASKFFLDRTKVLLAQRLEERSEQNFAPELVMSNIQNEMGVLGAAALALRAE